jgi:hypothetical protein
MAQMFKSLFRAQITFQVMTFPRQSAGNHHPIGAILKGP